MLEYKIKLNSNDNISPINIISLSLSEDMSTLCGVTYASEHIDTLDKISFSSDTSGGMIQCDFTSENHQRQGAVFIEGDVYEVKTDYASGHPMVYGSATTWDYIEFENNYYYVYTDEDDVKWVDIPYLVQLKDGKIEINSGYTSFMVENSGTTVSLNYGIWIDDDSITFHGQKYIVDFDYQDDKHDFALREYEYSNPVFETDLNIKYMSVQRYSVKERYDVTYFEINVDSESLYEFKNITCGGHAILFNYDDVLSKLCTNIISGIPTWNIYDISGDTSNPISAMCYASGVTSSGVCLSSNTFSSYTIDDIVDEFGSFWTYLIDDVTETPIPLSVELQNTNSGRYLLVNVDSQYMVGANSDIIFRDNQDSIQIDLVSVSADPSPNDYIIYNNRTYYRQEHLCDQVIINNELFDITYEDLSIIQSSGNSGTAHVSIYGTVIDMYTADSGATLEKRDTQVVSGNSFEWAKYEIVKRDGIQIEGNNYPIIDVNDEDSYNSSTFSASYVEISKSNEYRFKVIDTYGSNIMVMQPNMMLNESDVLTADDIHTIQERICYDVCQNQDVFTMFYKHCYFGQYELENGLGYISSGIGSSTVDYYHLLDSVEIYGRGQQISFNIPFTCKPANNIIQDNIQYSQFYETNRQRLINSYVDMEKDVYYPMYPKTDGSKYVFSNGYPVMLPVYEIQANLHFRTRNLDNWKVIESWDDPKNCNWFVTDYEPYTTISTEAPLRRTELMEASDLLGLLNFTNNDVYYQKKKVEKSFLRFSIYDSPDPQTQTLLDTSTIWLDETYAYKKYISNTKRLDDLFFNTIGANSVSSHSINVLAEPISGNTYTLNDENRISSRFTIRNKYETEGSSEGFYLYIFKEYTKSLHPVPLYMKVEFNHAGIGQTIPFIVPMAWNQGDICTPTKALTLDDIERLKIGYALDDIYMQTYIPLYCAYDKLHHQYFYFFDDRYVTNDNGVVKLNLFEIKVANSDVESLNINHNFRITDIDIINNLIMPS